MSEQTTPQNASAPPRGLGVAQGTAMTIGAVLGTGVLSLPALAAQLAGPASLLAWLALVLLSIPLSATFTGLGTRYPDGGGVATFARRAFGPTASAMVGWCFYFAVPIGAPSAAGFAGAYVADLVGGGLTTQVLTAVALITTVSTMNWFGIKVSGGVQLAIAAALATLLALATVVSLPHAQLSRLTPFVPHGWGAVGAATALLVWAFAGWEAVASLSAEYSDPGREIPRVTAMALVVIGVLYLGVAFAVVTALGATPSSAPLSDLLQFGFGPLARPVTTAVAVLLSLGAMNAYLASVSRLGYALGRDGSLPAWFGVLHGGVPRRSLAVVTTLSFVALGAIAFSGLPMESLISVVTGSFTLVYVVACAAALVLLPRWRLVWWSALISALATAVLAVLTGWQIIPALAVAVVAASYSWTRRHR